MDIKPVKKRRQRPSPHPGHPSVKPKQDGRRSITLKSRVNLPSPAKLKHKTKKLKVVNYLSSKFFPISFFVLLCVLYLPASKFISTSEQYKTLLSESSSLNLILDNIVYMPQKFLVFIINNNNLNGELILKALMFVFSIGTVYLFFLACLKWYGKNLAIITTFLFSTSTWMILSSQSLDFNNFYLLFVPLVIYVNYLLKEGRNILLVAVAVILFAATLYSPGMVWPALGLIFLLPLFLQKIIAKYSFRNIWVLFALTVASIAPLLASLILRPVNLTNVLVGEGQITFYAFAQNLQNSFQAMFLTGLPDNNLWLVGTPVFNYLAILFFIFGLICLVTYRDLRQHRNFIVASLVFSMLTIAFVGLPALPLIVPTVFLTAGFGIKLILDNWYVLFPSNPVARHVGLSLIVFIVLLSSGYGVVRYYVAWPEAKTQVSTSSSEKAV